MSLPGEYTVSRDFFINLSLRGKRSRTKRTKFGKRVLVFPIRDARKMGREQKDGRKGVGEGKEGNTCPQTPRF